MNKSSCYKNSSDEQKRKILRIEEKLKIMKCFKIYKNERVGSRSKGVLIRDNASEREKKRVES